MNNVDTLKFRVGISGTYWGEKRPEYSIAISGKEYVRGFIEAESDVETIIEFDAVLDEGAHRLEIGFLNKNTTTDVVKDEYNNVVQDILLNITSLEIEDIDLANLRYSHSHVELVKKQIYNGAIVSKIDNCVNLGFTSTYVLEFTSPFYIWLLENL